MSSDTGTYRGRFAPSPTGLLHWGSLVTALASWLEARTRGGTWLVRIDDLDPPRVVAGAADQLLLQLHRLGLEPDERVYFQSERNQAYRAAVAQLLDQGDAFHCALSRRQLRERGGVHPGRETAVAPGPDTVIRMAVADTELGFTDLFQGPQSANLQASGGAFTLQRRDGPYSYQLACALDEAWLGITHVIRGTDLLASTFRQRWILQRLGLPLPEYGHLPVLLDDAGHKLSKSEDADPVDSTQPAVALTRTLTLLEQQPPRELTRASVQQVLDWGLAHWDPQPLRGLRQKYARN